MKYSKNVLATVLKTVRNIVGDIIKGDGLGQQERLWETLTLPEMV